MVEHPLYVDAPLAPVEEAEALQLNPACSRCTLSAGCRAPCLAADGEAGGLLVVGGVATKHDDASGRPFSGPAGSLLRQELLRSWTGPVVFDLAVRCAPQGDFSEAETQRAIEECRGYLAGTLVEAKPARVIAVGSEAAFALLGRTVHPITNRRSYGWLWNNGTPVPVFVVPELRQSNRFIAAWAKEDLQWALTHQPPKPAWMDAKYAVVATEQDAVEACADLAAADWFAWDTETAGIIHSDVFLVLCLSAVAQGSNKVWVWDRSALENEQTFTPLRKLLEDPSVAKVGQNEKYDRQAMLCAFGFHVRGLHGDTRLWRKLLDAESEANLDVMADLVGMGGHKDEAKRHLDDAVKRVQKMRAKRAATESNHELSLGVTVGGGDVDPVIATAVALGADPLQVAYGLLPRKVLHRYAARDALTTARVAEHLEGQLHADAPIRRIWSKVVSRAAHAISRVESWGVPASKDRMLAFHTYLDGKSTQVRKRLDHYAPGINWSSTPQLREILFKKLRLKPVTFTATGSPSTDEEALQALKLQHPIAADILEYRALQKLDGQYALGLMDHVRSDGRIHGSIWLDGARSGRTSMSNPNLQNIRRADDADGKMAKDCFAAPPGYLLLQADYSQLELRIAALLSGDPEMIAIFREGVDYHQRTAELIAPIVWGLPADKIGKPHRTAAKAFNFGILYGMSDEGIASRAGCTVEEAQKIRAAIFGRMRKLDRWIQQRLHETQTTGFAWTYWEGERARRRPLWRIADRHADDDYQRELANKAKNSAWNTPIQGTASEFCVASLARGVEAIEREGMPAELILPIHDALMFLVPERHLYEVAYEVRDIMCGYDTGEVPLVADFEAGPSWGSMEKLKLAA